MTLGSQGWHDTAYIQIPGDGVIVMMTSQTAMKMHCAVASCGCSCLCICTTSIKEHLDNQLWHNSFPWLQFYIRAFWIVYFLISFQPDAGLMDAFSRASVQHRVAVLLHETIHSACTRITSNDGGYFSASAVQT